MVSWLPHWPSVRRGRPNHRCARWYLGALGAWGNHGEMMIGWWFFNHLEKYESQWEGLSHIYIYYGK